MSNSSSSSRKKHRSRIGIWLFFDHIRFGWAPGWRPPQPPAAVAAAFHSISHFDCKCIELRYRRRNVATRLSILFFFLFFLFAYFVSPPPSCLTTSQVQWIVYDSFVLWLKCMHRIFAPICSSTPEHMWLWYVRMWRSRKHYLYLIHNCIRQNRANRHNMPLEIGMMLADTIQYGGDIT